MKKKLIIVGMLLAFLLIGCENTKSNNNSNNLQEEKRDDVTFRNSIWGDDVETVKKYEKEVELTQESDMLIGNEMVTVSDNEATVGYVFDNGKLYRGVYGFKIDEGVGERFYITKYETIKEKLTSLYGEPIQDEIVPLVDQEQIDYSGEEKSLRYGYVGYVTSWQTDTTNIVLGLMSQNYELNFTLYYSDINYEENINELEL